MNELLGRAYHLREVSGDGAGAAQLLREAAQADAKLMAGLRVEGSRLRAIVAARSQGGQCGCHVSRVMVELIDRALR